MPERPARIVGRRGAKVLRDFGATRRCLSSDRVRSHRSSIGARPSAVCRCSGRIVTDRSFMPSAATRRVLRVRRVWLRRNVSMTLEARELSVCSAWQVDRTWWRITHLASTWQFEPLKYFSHHEDAL